MMCSGGTRKGQWREVWPVILSKKQSYFVAMEAAEYSERRKGEAYDELQLHVHGNSGTSTLLYNYALGVFSAARRCTHEYPFCMGKRGTKRVLEYSRLAMGFAHVRASRYGIR